jgi:hypothetical protein
MRYSLGQQFGMMRVLVFTALAFVLLACPSSPEPSVTAEIQTTKAAL